MDNILGYNLKKYRTEHKLSQEAFANMLGISRTALRGYESGQNHPTSIILICMAKALNCSIDDLLGHNIENPITISSSEPFSNIKEKILYLDDLIKKNLSTYNDLVSSKKRTDLKYSELTMSKKRVDRMLDELTMSKKRIDRMFDELTMSNKRNDLTYAELERTINRLTKTQALFKEITQKFIDDNYATVDTNEELNIEVLDLSQNIFKGASFSSNTFESNVIDINEYIKAPLFGCTAAGIPCLADDCIEKTFIFDDDRLLPSYSYFATTVSGDSMDKIYDADDILLVRSQSFANDGDLVIACIDNEVTFKRFFSEGDNVILSPESTNPIHTAQIYPKEKVIINGLVLGKIKEYLASEIF